MRKEETITPFLIGIAYAFIRCLGRSSTQTSVVLSVSFGNLLYDTSRIQEAFFALFPVIVAHLIFGRRIYKFFRNCPDYYFIRKGRSASWFIKECFNIFLKVFLYEFILLVTYSATAPLICNFTSASNIEVMLSVYYVLTYSIFVTWTSILINVISMKFGSIGGFAMIESLILCMLGLYLTLGNLSGGSKEYLYDHRFYMYLNPFWHIVIGEQKSVLFDIGGIDLLEYGFPLELSIGINFMILLIIIGIGALYTKKCDIISDLSEV